MAGIMTPRGVNLPDRRGLTRFAYGYTLSAYTLPGMNVTGVREIKRDTMEIKILVFGLVIGLLGPTIRWGIYTRMQTRWAYRIYDATTETDRQRAHRGLQSSSAMAIGARSALVWGALVGAVVIYLLSLI